MIRFSILVLLIVWITRSAIAVDFKSTNDGDFNDGSTWGGTAPTAGLSVEVGDTVWVTVTESSSFGALEIKNGGTLIINATVDSIKFTTFKFSGTNNTLIVNGKIIVNEISVTSNSNYIQVGTGGTLDVTQGISFNGAEGENPSLDISNDGNVNVGGWVNVGNNASMNIDGNMTLTNPGAGLTNNGEITVGTTGTLDVAGSFNNSGTVNNYGTISGTQPTGGTLPIELTYFNAQYSSSQVTIDWQTASEENNDYFTLERSKDGIKYEIIGTIEGSGDSYTPLNYSFTDNNPYQGISYYRLTQTDYDGKFESFSPVSVAYINEGDLKIGPNPAKSQINVSIGGEVALGKISIYNLTGAVVKSIDMNSNYHTLNIDNLPIGTYMMIISAGNEMISKKFIKN